MKTRMVTYEDLIPATESTERLLLYLKDKKYEGPIFVRRVRDLKLDRPAEINHSDQGYEWNGYVWSESVIYTMKKYNLTIKPEIVKAIGLPLHKKHWKEDTDHKVRLIKFSDLISAKASNEEMIALLQNYRYKSYVFPRVVQNLKLHCDSEITKRDQAYSRNGYVWCDSVIYTMKKYNLTIKPSILEAMDL